MMQDKQESDNKRQRLSRWIEKYGMDPRETNFASPGKLCLFSSIRNYSTDFFNQALQIRLAKLNTLPQLALAEGLTYLRGGDTEFPEIEDDKFSTAASLLIVIDNELSKGAVDEVITTERPIARRGLATSSEQKKRRFNQYSRGKYDRSFPESIAPPSRRIVNSKHDKEALILSLYMLSQLETRVPGAIEDVFNLKTSDDDGYTWQVFPTTVALSSLEAMHNLGLLYDQRFARARNRLRAVVLNDEETNSLEKLQVNYHYSVVREISFWIEGELQIRQKGGLGHVSGLDDRSPTQLRLYQISTWDTRITDLKKMDLKIKRSRPHSAITSFAIKASGKEGATRDALKRDTLHQIAEGRQLQLSRDRTANDLIRDKAIEMDKCLQVLVDSSEEEPVNLDTFSKKIGVIADFFRNDIRLSQKSRMWFTRLSAGEIGEQDDYSVDATMLAERSLFRWLRNLKDPKTFSELMEAVRQQPKEFYLLAKLMAYDLAGTTFKSTEDEFLLTNSSSCPEPEQVVEFFERLCLTSETENQEQAIKEISKSARREILDLTSTQGQQKINKRLKDWYSNKRLPYTITFDAGKSVGIIVLTGMLGLARYELARIENSNAALQAKDNLNRPSVLLPDKISREQLKHLKPAKYADIIHLPQNLADGQVIGFFPVDLDDGPGSFYVNPMQVELADTYFFDNPNNQFVYTNRQLVYRPQDLTNVMYPPVGYRIVKVYQKGGDKPMVSNSGEITWWGYTQASGWKLREKPEDIIIIAEPLEEDDSGFPGITMYKNVTASSYYLGEFDYGKARHFIDSLENGDQTLKYIYISALEELKNVQPTDLDTLDNIILKYSSQYLQYIYQPGRFYQLSLQIDKPVDTEYPVFEEVVENSDSGYFCAVASEALREFWISLGVHTPSQIGYNARLFDGEAWTHIAHANNRLLLPTGRIAFIDTTPPPVDGKTPQEDLDALQPKSPYGNLDDKSFLDTVKDLAKENKVPLAASAGLMVGLAFAAEVVSSKRIKRRYARLLEGYKSFEFAPEESELVSAAIYSINAQPMDDLELYTGRSLEILDILRRVDMREYGNLVKWFSESALIAVLNINDPDLLGQAISVLISGYYRNEGGIRNVLTDQLCQIIETAGKNRDNAVNLLPPELILAIKAGLMVNYSHFHSNVAHLQESALTSATLSPAQTKRELEEKLKLNRILVFEASRGMSEKSRNYKYLSLLTRANQRMT